MSERPPIAANVAAQHGPRPLPLFLEMLRSETAANPDLREQALRGLTAYQHAPREPAPPSLPIVARAGRAVLRDRGGSGAPLLIAPSLINPPSIVDFSPGRSLAGFLSGQGHRVLIVDWGKPTAADAMLGAAGHVEQLLAPLIDAVAEPVAIIGYCLGGTLAIAAAALRPVRGLATIAGPWRFAGYGGAARHEMADLWTRAEPACRALGVVPMEMLQAAFWQLDPARTIRKYAAFASLAPGSDAAQAFVRLEDWVNGGAPLPYAAGRDLFETLLRDDAPGHGRWQVGGRAIDPAQLTCPAVEFLSATDRITPASTAAGFAERRVVDAGHVGMMVGRHAHQQLWAPLAAWLDSLPG